ncbi:MAG: hypothetical protein ACI4LI_09875 [Candidatus Fimenecus sp.]
MSKRIIALVLTVLMLTLLLFGCGAKTADDATQTSAAPETTTQSNETTLPAATAATAQEQTTAPPAKESPAPETTAAFTMPEKTGDMYFTDDADNKFIQAVVQKYGSDPARLACIYVVPEGDSNHVFEFNGKTDQNGKLIRNESTLKYVYTLNADCSEITRTGGATGNDGVTAAQGLVVMQLTKKLILPKFEEELNG